MADQNKPDGRFAFTVPIRVLHNNLFTAKRFKRNGKEVGEPKFNADLGIPPNHPEWDACRAVAGQVAKAAFPGVPMKDIKFPWKSGEVQADKAQAAGKNRDFKRGLIIMPARTGAEYPPILSASVNGRFVEFDESNKAAAQPHFYAGMNAVVQIAFSAYTTDDGEQGVTARLNRVLSLGTGDRIRTSQSSADVFAGYLGKATTESPLGNSGADDDDEIPA